MIFPPASRYCCRANSKSESKRIPLRRLVNGIRRGTESIESLHTKERSSGREPAMIITAGSMIPHTTSVTMSTVDAMSCQYPKVHRTSSCLTRWARLTCNIIPDKNMHDRRLHPASNARAAPTVSLDVGMSKKRTYKIPSAVSTKAPAQSLCFAVFLRTR